MRRFLAGVGLALIAATAVAEERPRILVLPVVVHSSDSRVYLREGLADMVTSRLEQAGTFDVVRVDDPDQATTRESDAREKGRGVEADYVLFGSFTRFGEGASLDMQCIAVEEVAVEEGEEPRPPRQIFVQSGNVGDVIPDLDSLVGKISRFVGTPAATDGAEASDDGTVTTSQATLDELLRRVEALERAVGTEAPAPQEPAGPMAGPVAPPATPLPAPSAPEAP